MVHGEESLAGHEVAVPGRHVERRVPAGVGLTEVC